MRPVNKKKMVSWYSMALAITGLDVVVALKLFLGRFDIRTQQVAIERDEGFQKRCGDHTGSSKSFFFDHSDRKEISVDFMADCGDGFNSSYEIARLLAQPVLDIEAKDVD